MEKDLLNYFLSLPILLLFSPTINISQPRKEVNKFTIFESSHKYTMVRSYPSIYMLNHE